MNITVKPFHTNPRANHGNEGHIEPSHGQLRGGEVDEAIYKVTRKSVKICWGKYLDLMEKLRRKKTFSPTILFGMLQEALKGEYVDGLFL